MTCIVGIEFDGKVVMAGDNQATGWNRKTHNKAHSKVFQKNGILIGGAGSIRVAQIIEHGVKDPIAPDKDEEIYPWLVTVLVPSIRKSLKDEGHEQGCGQRLIAVRGQLWELQDDFSVLRSDTGYAAIGSGYEYALASLFTSVKLANPSSEAECKRMARRAILAAGTFCPSVGTRATVLST